MDALIVAGGRGTRLQPLTDTVLKPLLEFCGEPFLLGVMRRLAQAGVDRVLLVVGERTEPFDVLREPARELGLAFETVPEPEPLDTAGGIRSVAADLDGPFLVLNGDILTDVNVDAVVSRHREVGADATIVLTRVQDTSSYGVCVREGTRIVDFVEKPAPGSLPGQDTVNAGTYVLEPEVLLAHPQGRLSFERDVFPGLVARGGHLEGFVWDGVWADLGTPERYREGHRLALGGELSWPSVAAVPDRGDGVRVATSATIGEGAVVVGPSLVLDDAVVGPGARLGPYACIGERVRIAAGAQLPGAILHRDVRVDQDVCADQLLAGPGARVAQGARLGRGVVLGAGELVGAGDVLQDGERRPPARTTRV
ncbi:MAG TPA: NDP-sugar synthase [Nitriliruptorales bacterium]